MSKQRALVVGVSNYPPAFTSLPGVANDAREMATLLGSPQSRFRDGEVAVLTDAEATGAAVTERLAATLGSAEKDDTVFVYVAGHGTVVNKAYYFLPHDAVRGRIPETGLPLAALRDLFDGCGSRRVFVWLDFCYSGGIIERTPEADHVAEEKEIIERTLRVAKGSGKLIVAACTAEQTAKEPKYGPVKHGFFTLALLDGLRGKAANSDNEVTASSLYEYVVKRVESESEDQCPVMVGHMQGSIVLYSGPRKLDRRVSYRGGP